MFINLDGKTVHVVIKRKHIKNVYFKWEREDLIVTCNNFLREKDIEKLIHNNYKNLMNLKKRTPTSSLGKNEIYYLGEKYIIEFDGVSQTYIDGNKIISKDDFELNKFLLKQCNVVFTSRMNRIKSQFENLPEFTLKIRKMKSRWGVCNIKSMTITLNFELIKKDVSLIDYVIIHELCHFKYMNHSIDFWKEVEKYYPYHKMARKMLKESQYD